MNPTRKTFLTVSFAIAALAAPAFGHGDKDKEKEEIVPWESVPAAVQSTITSNSSGGKVTSVEKEMKEGAVEYEAKVTGTDGKMSEVKVGADGKLIKVEADDEKEHHHHDGDKDKDDDED